jgi:DNA-binding response OmpR family regulator
LSESYVLFVDPDPDSLAMLSRRMETLGHRARIVLGGEAALQEVRKAAPAIVVTEVATADLSGFQLCRALRDEYPNVPVVFLSTRDDEAEKFWAFHVGGKAFLRKPFEVDAVARELREYGRFA